MKYFTVKEIAEMLSVHDQTIRRKIQSGEIVGKNIGPANRPVYRVEEQDLKTYLES